jgi:hypothetical protein
VLRRGKMMVRGRTVWRRKVRKRGTMLWKTRRKRRRRKKKQNKKMRCPVLA